MAALSLTVLAGCAQLGPAATPESVVKERAQQRWQHLIARDFKSAFNYLPPSVQALSSPERYGSRFGTAASWTQAAVDKVSCEAEKCQVTLKIEAKPVLGPRFGDTISTYVDETWILEAGQWWLFQQI